MDVFNEKRCRLASVGVCCCLGVLAFFIIVPVSIVLNLGGGRCLLYASTTGFGSTLACAYPIVVSVIFQLGCCGARAAFCLLVLTGMFKSDLLNHKYILIACAAIDITSCVLTLISGGIISHGSCLMCSKIFNEHSDRCGKLSIYNPETSSFIDIYLLPLRVSEGGVWISWICWTLLIPLDIYLLSNSSLLTLKLPYSLTRGGSRESRESTRSNRKLFRRKDGADRETTTEASDASEAATSQSGRDPRVPRGYTAKDIRHSHREWSSVASRDDSPSRAPPPLPALSKVGDRGSGPRTPPPGQKVFAASDSLSLPRTPPPTRPVPPRPAQLD